jgi:hypothetical protein
MSDLLLVSNESKQSNLILDTPYMKGIQPATRVKGDRWIVIVHAMCFCLGWPT